MDALLIAGFVFTVCCIYLFLEAFSLKRACDYIRKYRRTVYAKLLEDLAGRSSLFRKVLDTVQTVILRSGFNWDAGWFAAFSAASFFISVVLFRRLGLLAAVMYGAAAVYVPYAVLLFMGIVNGRRIRKMYLNFLNVFSGFYGIEGNIVNSLRAASGYVGEPLKSILRKHVTVYERSSRSVEECLEGILREVRDGEFRKFIKFTKLHVKYGGNYGRTLAKLKEQAEKMYAVETMKATGSSVGTGIILLMIVINLMLVAGAAADPEVVYTLRSTPGGQAVAALNAAAIIFGLYMIKNINSA